MKVLRIQPKKYPEVIEIDGSLKSLQKEVAGPIQAVYPWDDPVALICNEEGKLIGLEPNRSMYSSDGRLTDIYFGTIVCIGARPQDEDFSSLTQMEAALYLMIYNDPEFSASKGDGKNGR